MNHIFITLVSIVYKKKCVDERMTIIFGGRSEEKIDDSTEKKQLYYSRIPYKFFPFVFFFFIILSPSSCIMHSPPSIWVCFIDMRWIYTLHIGWCLFSWFDLLLLLFLSPTYRHTIAVIIVDRPKWTGWLFVRYEKFHLPMTNFR